MAQSAGFQVVRKDVLTKRITRTKSHATKRQEHLREAAAMVIQHAWARHRSRRDAVLPPRPEMSALVEGMEPAQAARTLKLLRLQDLHKKTSASPAAKDLLATTLHQWLKTDITPAVRHFQFAQDKSRTGGSRARANRKSPKSSRPSARGTPKTPDGQPPSSRGERTRTPGDPYSPPGSRRAPKTSRIGS
eukprot:TRINITY_DN11849_c1_g1_i1.p1 TRINITY_DN11849_c1_g1~~TRINITY_DN11849_c1_g1_i1.p1  ORF type:complete len:190 (+),score=11.05 TRINITY_DN11849_c1_g1_i1:40-609(+)